MVSSTTTNARAFVPSSPPKKRYKRGRTTRRPSGKNAMSTCQRGPTKGQTQRVTKKVPKGKRKRQHNDRTKHDNVLLHRPSLPSSSPPGTLLERIAGSAEAEASTTLTDLDRIIDGDRVSSEDADMRTNLPFATIPHFYTPEPGEVERFLESVIGAPPPPPSPPPSSLPRSVHACLGDDPPLALETLNLPVAHLVTVHDPSSSVLYSPTQTAVDSISSANLTLDHFPLLGDTMAPPSPSTIEECRKHLAPVLLASARARDPGKHLDSEQCLELLSDDRCRNLFRRAKEMRLQLSSLVAQKAPANQGQSGSLKRDRVDDVDAWVRSTRSRFDSVNTVVSDASRRDSDITLVDFPGGRLPPRAPRAMLQASQAPSSRSLAGAQDQAPPYEVLVASPTTEDPPPGATSLIELVHQTIKIFPTLMPTGQPETETDMSGAPVGTLTGDQLDRPIQAVSPAPAQPSSNPSTTHDFVSHLPTQPGIWFRQQGGQYAEIVDVDIDMSDDMFYLSTERRPFRLRMHLRLCSVPVGVATESERSDAPASLQDVDLVIERHAVHWPKKGKLVVQVNPESERSTTWLPYTLDSDPLDVTGCVRPGKNTFRFIQLSDLSEFTFLLAASPPPPREEEWRSLDWASIVEARSKVADDGLSEFARIPVTVRS